ncbi:amino acid adenylation domain-containing protein [Streptomyces zhaozhouensis]|uniref:Phenyloxazoline synthase MbtB n=1 Tax=Streptomyces zhaozhouensis TaxID=1300267 RepID=A0A286DVH6_9ACTN|nr:non-ribosomal peptide synthetase [Streptomyces zhaozhouensis]SOD62667.1 amino acid adenylation domain-containing protein [Streptomyces zhaozhouensis]
MTDASETERATTAEPSLQATVAALLGIPADDIGPEDDLFELGLDSLGLIRLSAEWRRDGFAVSFEQLADAPTVGDWARLLAETPRRPPPAESGTASARGPAGRAESDTAGDNAFPLGLMQHAYWIGRQEGQPLGGVGAHFYAELSGSGVDPARLSAAVTALRRRHETLRVTVLDDGRQRVGDAVPERAVTVHDLGHRTAEEAETFLAELRDRLTHRRMDVESGEVFDVALTLLPAGATRVHLDLDMIAADAASMRVLLSDLQRLYADPAAELPALVTRYGDYLRRTRAERSEERERDRAWWSERLPAFSAPPALPTVVDPLSPRSSEERFRRTTRLHHRLDAERTERLRLAARRHGLTPTAVLATAFAEVMAAWSAEPRFFLNLPLFHRDGAAPDAESLVGDFSSSILLEVDLSATRPFAEQAADLQSRLRSAIAHGSYSGVEVLRDLTRAGGGTPVLAPVVYTSALGLGEVYDKAVRETFGEPAWIVSQGPQVWLDAQVTELDGGILLNWDVRAHAFAPGVVPAAFHAYRTLVESLLDEGCDWRLPVALPLPDSQRAVRERVNDTATPLAERRLHEGFHRAAARHPERVALVDERGRSRTFSCLARWASQISALLVARGVGAGDRVVVSLPRGAAQVAAVLGVLGTGAAYVPLGVGQPGRRAALVLAAAEAAAVLTDERHRERWRGVADGSVEVLPIESADRVVPAEPVLDQPVDSPAYVLFTSGSTGTPKGVEVSHRAAMNTLEAINSRFGVGPDDRGLALAELDFDMSVYDLFGPLSAGGSVVLIGEDAGRDAPHWASLVRDLGVTVVNCVPALLEMLLTAAESGTDPGTSLRLVLLGGDWVGLDLPGRLRALVPDARLVALGGMTEAAVHSTVFEVHEVDPAWSSVPWGVPLPNMSARVVDSRGRDRPDWVPGELWISGAGLASGYRADPVRTAERFVEHAGRRWYRTGDRARYRDDGVLEFLGRTDHQIKLRGHRVELGEVEAAATAHPDVHAAVALVTGAPARLALVAAGEAAPEGVLEALRCRLPAYMVPGGVTVVDALPLTRNGKPDRAAAAELAAGERVTGAGAAPSGWVESVVARVWSEVLGVADIGRADSFFALGGDSLLATRVIVALRGAGVGGARIARLFAHPRLKDFAAGLVRGRAVGEVLAEGDPGRRHEPFPPTDVQRAFWIGRDDRLPLGGVGTYHYSEFDGHDVDLDRMERAWRRLVERHEMLRAVFDEDGRQRILPTVPPVRIAVTEVATEDAATAALDRLREESSHRVLDPTRWPLFDIRAVRYPHRGRTRTRLAVGLDYIALDGASIILLYGELDTLYQDPEAPLPPIDVSFRDYVLEVVPDAEAVRRARAYWLERLDVLPRAPQLPLAADPSALARPRFTRRARPLSADRWSRLRARAARHQLTPSVVLLLCYVEVLAAWSDRGGVTVNLTLFNRLPVHPHIHRVAGDFTSVSLIGHRPAPDEDWLTAAHRLQRVMGEDLDHREESAIWLMQELARRTGTVEAAMPVVFSSSVGVGDREVKDLSDSFPAKVFGISQTPQVMLDNQVTEAAGGIVVSWDAVEELFLPGVLDAMFDTYCGLLDRLVDEEWSGPLPVAPPAEQRARRAAFTAPRAAAPDETLHAAVFRRAAAAPGRTALVLPDRSVSYGALAGRALRLAAALASRGVRGGDTVVLALTTAEDQVLAALGSLRAGAVFTALAPEAGDGERRAHCEAVGATLVVTDLPWPEGPWKVATLTGLLTTGDSPPPVDTEDPDAPALRVRAGGDGTPRRWVTHSHRALVDVLAELRARLGVDQDDRGLLTHGLPGPPALFAVFGLLGAGGTLVVPDTEAPADPDVWRRLIDRHRITVWNGTSWQLDALLDRLPDGLPDGRDGAPLRPRRVLVHADRPSLALPARLREEAGADSRLLALAAVPGAPLDAALLVTEDAATPASGLPRGVPLAGQRLRVVDALGGDCPEWVTGEVHLGGAGTPWGVREDADDRPPALVTHGGERWYRTGTRGRFRPDGTLELLGPSPRRVAVGGRPVELDEVEAVLEAHPAVAHAVVPPPAAESGGRRRALVVPRARAAVDAAALARHVGATLPPHAVPTDIGVTDRLPLAPDGLPDAARLVAAATEEEPSGPPRTDTEKEIAALWAEALGHQVTDRYANFFAEGGDSLTALRLVAAVNAALGVDVPVRAFLAASTLADLATQVDSRQPTPLQEESGII